MKKEFFTNPNFEDFIRILNRYKVTYCITGAYAVSFHAEPRYTHDIDFYISRRKDNSNKVAAVIKEFFGEGIDERLFEDDKVIVRMGIEPNKIELSNHLTGLNDKEIIKHRVKNKYGNTVTYYIGMNELIKNKKIVKDLPLRGNKALQDKKDYLTLLEVKRRKKLNGADK